MAKSPSNTPHPPHHPHTYTSDFHEEYAAETDRLLRLRFQYYTAAMAGLSLLSGAVSVWGGLVMPVIRRWQQVEGAAAEIRPDVWAKLLDMLVFVGIYGAVAHACWRGRLRSTKLLTLTYWLIVSTSTASMVAYNLVQHRVGFAIESAFLAHVLAACFLPWTLRDAVMPMVPLLAINAALGLVFGEMGLGLKIASIVGSVLVGVPGCAIAWFKDTRRAAQFKARFLESRYMAMRRELVDARRIHESLFPKPESQAGVRFDYRYEPMRQIGGDYLFAKFCSSPTPTTAEDGETSKLTILLLDVTGHGVGAALTVNRLYGEVERLFAEDPQTRPGEVLKALNRYVYLTMADHALYVTACCARVDTDADGGGAIEYANAGHPPAFLRSLDGSVEQLDSTSLVLGVNRDQEFDPSPVTRPFRPGDVLVAYTDGANEAMNGHDEMLGVVGILRVVSQKTPSGSAPAVGPGGWAQRVLAAVDAHRFGPTKDDTLVVEVVREFVTGAPVKATATRTSEAKTAAASPVER